MEKRKGKASSRANKPPSGRSGSLNSSTDEAFVPEVDIRGDYVPKESYLYLMRAFDDIKEKLISAINEKKRLQERHKGLIRNFKDLESKSELQEKEKESLRKKVELSFHAYDEKYKETENLKKELQAIKEEKGSRHVEDRGEEQQDLALQTGEAATQTKASFDPVREENETADNSTQTLEEKTDEVGCLLSSTPMKLLRNCGLEIVFENGRYYLLLSNRDLLKKWIENETDGKVSVAFEKTPVFERFVQTDVAMIKEHIQCEECPKKKAVISNLKSSIIEQADLIKQLRRELPADMAGLLQKEKAKMASSASVLVQTEGKFYDEHSMNKQVKTLTKYKDVISKAMDRLEQKLSQLKNDLVYQRNFSKRLLLIINDSMHLPQSFVSSILNAAQGKAGKMKKGQKKAISRSVPGNEMPENFSDFSLPYSNPEPFLSMPVQETDRRLRVKIAKPKDPDYDPSLDDDASPVAPAESRSMTSDSSASIVPADEAQHTLVTSNKEEVLAPTSATGTEQASGHDDSDEIVVIDENEGGAVGDSGVKECPICYVLYTPATSQQEYEKHVMNHFKDLD